MNIIPFSKTYIEENNKVKLKDSEKKEFTRKGLIVHTDLKWWNQKESYCYKGKIWIHDY